jgi:AcrR family transcriptional regulator
MSIEKPASSLMATKNTDTRSRILEATWRLMEEKRGTGVSMSKIAAEAGVSRQALYLHFASRVDLISATVRYVDEVKGLEKRMQPFLNAETGAELLDACIEVWCDYIPEVYGIAKALLSALDTDEAAAVAWNDCMNTLLQACRRTVETLDREGQLSSDWTCAEATDMLYAMISIQNWESLTIGCGWSNARYIRAMQIILKRALIAPLL